MSSGGGCSESSALWARTEENRINSHPIIHCPKSEGVSEVSERGSEQSERASERVSGASGPVLQSVFLVDPDHSAVETAFIMIRKGA